jgi:hypothetical protein
MALFRAQLHPPVRDGLRGWLFVAAASDTGGGAKRDSEENHSDTDHLTRQYVKPPTLAVALVAGRGEVAELLAPMSRRIASPPPARRPLAGLRVFGTAVSGEPDVDGSGPSKGTAP